MQLGLKVLCACFASKTYSQTLRKRNEIPSCPYGYFVNYTNQSYYLFHYYLLHFSLQLMKATLTAIVVTSAFVATSVSTALAAEESYTLTLKNHKFSPADLIIPAGKKVKVTVKNLDATPAEFESDDFEAEKVIPAGKQVDVFIGPLKAGTYEFHDEYHEAESKTQLTVK